VIVRLMGEGQYRVDDGLRERLNELDNRATEAVESGDEGAFRERLAELSDFVRGKGERLPDEDLSASDLIVPPADLSMEEAKELFAGEGLIPDLPS
jgi:hypothetical protein